MGIKINKSIEEIREDILKNNFKLGLTRTSYDEFDISSAFDEIFIRVSGGKVLILDYNYDNSVDNYEEVMSFILKNWIIVDNI